MRSSAPIPGNPWPHDMTITVDDQPNMLLELLWIREAHQLQPRGEDLPPLLSDSPPVPRDRVVNAEERAHWDDAWPRMWDAAVAHAGTENDPRLFQEIQRTANGSAERADLLRRIVGPDWRDEFGGGALDTDSYGRWQQQAHDHLRDKLPTSLEASPERRDLESLILAWRAGLTKVVTIPCAGDFTRKIGPHGLLTTQATRDTSAKYRQALSSFI
jgi:hypothetical protein